MFITYPLKAKIRQSDRQKNNLNVLPREGKMVSVLTDPGLEKYQRDLTSKRNVSWSNSKDYPYAVSKPASNDRNYFTPGFLNGYKPFEIENSWLVPQAIAMRTRYRLDEKQFRYSEVWQTGKEFWYRRRGDCEDHAILLADWLIEMGLDARVVTGKTRDGYHAWTVLLKEGKAYVFEATDKTPPRIPPEQYSAKDLFPERMFNRDKLWYNTEPFTNLNYLSDKWVLVSKFVENP